MFFYSLYKGAVILPTKTDLALLLLRTWLSHNNTWDCKGKTIDDVD